VEVDETFIGPDPRKMHRGRRLKRKLGEHGDDKTIVMGMLDRDARKVRAKMVPNVKREIINAVESGSTVYTDQHVGYDGSVADFV
jgi:hypothetical protein